MVKERFPSANPVNNAADPRPGDDHDSAGVVASAAGDNADAVPVSCSASVAAVAAAVRAVDDETIASAVVDVPVLPAVTGENGDNAHGRFSVFPGSSAASDENAHGHAGVVRDSAVTTGCCLCAGGAGARLVAIAIASLPVTTPVVPQGSAIPRGWA